MVLNPIRCLFLKTISKLGTNINRLKTWNKYALFSKSGFTDRSTDLAEVEEVALITLDKMYEGV